MEYRLQQHNATGEVYAVREDGLANGPLGDNDYRDNDAPDATIRIDWAAALDYRDRRPDLWDNDDYTVLATDLDPLAAATDSPPSLNPDTDKPDRLGEPGS